jgi:hypothetical protein
MHGCGEREGGKVGLRRVGDDRVARAAANAQDMYRPLPTAAGVGCILCSELRDALLVLVGNLHPPP